MKPLRYFVFVACCVIINSLAAQDTTQQVEHGRFNSRAQQDKPYVILISADGFRYDLADTFHAQHLLNLRSRGVQAQYMRPAFPSLTFPNHYSIVTGLYPSHHGLVDNNFYDRARGVKYSMGNHNIALDSTYYGGVPLWVLAEKNQMVSASFYWVGSEVAVQHIRPTYYFKYSTKINIDKRLQEVKAWLQLPPEKRPHFITFYFPEVDHAEHQYGTGSRQTAEAVAFVDESVGRLNDMVDSLHLPVNFIFVSDHGMTNVDTLHFIDKLPGIDTSKFVIPEGDAVVHLYAKDKKDILPAYRRLKAYARDFDVYLAANVPPRWHYGKADDRYNRIGDILLTPHLPKVFNLSGKRLTPGKHGFDNYLRDMRATFYAWGPAFKEHLIIRGFDNIHIYPLIATILGLKYPNNIDGRLEVLKPILRR